MRGSTAGHASGNGASIALWLALFGMLAVLSGLGFGQVEFTFSDLAIVTGALAAAAGVLLSSRRHAEALERKHPDERVDCGGGIKERIEHLEDVRWQLRDNDQRLRELLDAQDDVILRHDAAGLVTFVNRSFCSQFDVEPGEVLGTAYQPYPCLSGESAGPQAADWQERKTERTAKSLVETANGPRWFQWRTRTIPSPSGLASDSLTIGRDITDRIKHEAELSDSRERAEAANRAKSRFLAAISHEIRTPMNGILGMSGLLSETELTPEQRTYTVAVDQSARTLLSLIDELLDFSRIEAGRLELCATPFSLADCVQSVVELLAPRTHEKGLEMAWTVDPMLPARVVGDEKRFRQILLNLVGNAVKFTERGGVTVRLETETADSCRCAVKLTVSDTGRGMAPDDVAKAFKEFERVSAEGSAGEVGTGLGLAIALRLARAMGGDITVATAPGRGASFTLKLTLPVCPEQSGSWLVVPEDVRSNSVVLACDRLVERRALAAILRDLDIDVSESDDLAGEIGQAPSATNQDRVDVLIVDGLQDPQEAGEALRQLRRSHHPARGLVLVNAEEKAGLSRFTAEGFDGYLIRPVRPRSLVEQLSRQSMAGNETRGGPSEFSPELAPASAPNGHSPLQVLLAEDNDINALLAETMLKTCGCSVRRVVDGGEAVRAATAAAQAGAPFDLVLMDLHMPKTDGLSATRSIHEAFKTNGQPRPPIVAVTANAFDDDRKLALEAGMDGYLVKPFGRSELIEVLDKYRTEKRQDTCSRASVEAYG